MHLIDTLEPRRLMSVSLHAPTGVLTVTGTPRNDHLAVALAPNNKLKVTENGRSTLFARSAVRQLVARGGAGADVITVSPAVTLPTVLMANGIGGSDGVGGTILGGGGRDRIFAAPKAPGQLLDGRGGDDHLGLNHAPRVTARGGDGWDTFRAIGTGSLDGGTGADTADFTDHAAGMTIGNADVLAYEADYIVPAAEPRLVNFESFHGTRGDDVIFGTHTANALFGHGGNDTIYALSGNDDLDGGDGDDVLISATDGQFDIVVGGRGTDRTDRVYDPDPNDAVREVELFALPPLESYDTPARRP